MNYQKNTKNTRNIKNLIFLKKTLAFPLVLLYTKQVASERRKRIRKWSIGQAVKTSPSHGENRGSIPLSTAEKLLVIQELFVLSYRGEMEETGMD